jgi:rubredoxin
MQWVCDICGYVHDDDEPPMSCPMCGAPKSKFSEWDGEDDFYNEDIDDDEEVDDDLDEGEDDEKDRY